MKYGRVLAS